MPENINPQQLKTLLSLKPEEVLIPLRANKEEVGKIKAIKLSDKEASLVQDFQDFLVEWGYLPDNTFESLFIYLFNLACSLNKAVVEYEALMGRAFDPDNISPKA